MNEKEQINSDWIGTFYRGLQELVDSSFPKTCPKCGKIFASSEAFLNETIPVRDIKLEDRSGLFCLEGGDIKTVVGLFRNCTCGTTIMADFQDRRDNSEKGQSRRNRFTELMDMLETKDIPRADARRELLRVLQGKTSSLINELLGNIDIA